MQESKKDNAAGGAAPSLRFEVIDNLLVMVHGQRAPSSEDWRKFTHALRLAFKHHGTAKILGFTPGPAPNAVQRSELMALANEHPLLIAICTESRVARGAIQALSWAAHMHVKAFEKRDWEGACTFLGLPPARGSFFGSIVERLDAELSHASGTFPTASKD